MIIGIGAQDAWLQIMLLGYVYCLEVAKHDKRYCVIAQGLLELR